MRICHLVLAAALMAGTAAPAAASGTKFAQDAAEVLAQLQADDRVQKAYGAMGVQRIAREQWGLTLFDHPRPRPWQTALAPAAPILVSLLADDGPMQWVNWTSDEPIVDQTTTPRKEATRALLALERPSLIALIAALDRPELAAKADELLRQLAGDGPTDRTRAAWATWWAANEARPLRNERGQSWVLALLAIAVLGGAALVIWRQRTASDRRSGLRLSLATTPASPPATADPPANPEPAA